MKVCMHGSRVELLSRAMGESPEVTEEEHHSGD